MLFQSANLRVEVDSAHVATLWLDVQGQRFNVLSRTVLQELAAAIAALRAQPGLAGLVIRSAKATGFLAGADIQSFTQISSPQEAENLSALGQQVFQQLIDAAIVPTVALIEGPCLGGGLELALCCDVLLAVDRADTQIGLPEVELGLIPGWGGTQRLPRRIGLERALNMILGGKRLNAREAQAWGLVDRVLSEQAAAAGLSVAGLVKTRRRRTWRQLLLESNPFGRSLILRGTRRLLKRRVPDAMPAPWEALEAVAAGVTQDLPTGLARERAAIGRLAMTPACRNLVTLFLRREAARKLPAQLRELASAPIRKVGVVGAGTMGAGIAQLAAVKGFPVVVQEANVQALQQGVLRVGQLVDQAVKRRILTENEARERLAQLKFTTKWEGFEDVDLVVEAVFEDPKVKRSVFHQLEKCVRSDTVLATNTSSLLVSHLQEGMLYPERLGGLHFFNPVHKMPLVEVVRARQTTPTAVALLAQWAAALGKTPVVVRDGPGFLVNRVLFPYLGEAVVLVAEGLGIAEVDEVMRRFGMPMGPLELLDQVGLDVASHVAEAIRPVFGNRFPAAALYGQLVKDRGWLGQKSGRGFYVHGGKRKQGNAEAEAALRAAWTEGRGPTVALPAAVRAVQARDRLVLPMVNEAATCLAEELVDAEEDLDLALVLGTGWAPHRGGPLRYGRDRGLAEVVRALEELARLIGPRFAPCDALIKLAL